MNRYFIHLAYNGKPFHGWQIQPNAPSVQEEINKCLSLILREEIHIVGCGRTDTGVHASDFYAHFETVKTFTKEELEKLSFKMNRYFRQDIYINEIFQVEKDIHTRFDATSRCYKYIIAKVQSPFFSELSHHVHGDLDLKKMNQACKILFLHTDFTSFSKLHTQTKTNNCKIMLAEWKEKEDFFVFTIKADRFLRNMVRAITGTMLGVGQGKISLEEFENIIVAKNRSNAGVSVPGQALFLNEVEYPTEALKNRQKKGPAQSLSFA